MTEDTYLSVEPLPYMECVIAVKGMAALGGAPANLWALNSGRTGLFSTIESGEDRPFRQRIIKHIFQAHGVVILRQYPDVCLE